MDDTSANAPVFFDCEASGLDGVPIEIGWACGDRGGDVIHGEAHLIRPPANWQIEEKWDVQAAELHGITLDDLRRKGKTPQDITTRMNEVLNGRDLYADSAWDENWVRMLFGESNLEPSFTVWQTDAVTHIEKLAYSKGITTREYQAARAKANRLSPRQHRAFADARNLATLWLIVSRS
jgi:hypothetical protein